MLQEIKSVALLSECSCKKTHIKKILYWQNPICLVNAYVGCIKF